MASKGLNVKVPRLGRNRHGVYYVRSSALDEAGKRKVSQQSLHTKDPHLTKIFALKFCLALAQGGDVTDPREFMGRYDLDLPGGKASASDPEDHKRLMQAIAALTEARLKLAVLGAHTAKEPQVAPVFPPPPQTVPPMHPFVHSASMNQGGVSLKDALEAHLVDETQKGVLKAQTLVEKKTVYQDFMDLFGPIALNQVQMSAIAPLEPFQDRGIGANPGSPNGANPGSPNGANRGSANGATR